MDSEQMRLAQQRGLETALAQSQQPRPEPAALPHRPARKGDAA